MILNIFENHKLTANWSRYAFSDRHVSFFLRVSTWDNHQRSEQTLRFSKWRDREYVFELADRVKWDLVISL